MDQDRTEQDQPPAMLPCNCRHDVPQGIAACSDPRLVPRAVSLSDSRTSDRLAPTADPALVSVVHSPDDPVPRPTV